MFRVGSTFPAFSAFLAFPAVSAFELLLSFAISKGFAILGSRVAVSIASKVLLMCIGVRCILRLAECGEKQLCPNVLI